MAAGEKIIPKKIVIIGPESTGKSTLCARLAAHFNTTWVEEYAREYLLKNGTDYTFENLLDIAKGQVKNEQLAEEQLAVKQWADGSGQWAVGRKQVAVGSGQPPTSNLQPPTSNLQPPTSNHQP